MPLCARCSGIYLSFVLTLVVLFIVFRKAHRGGQAHGLALAILAIYVASMVFDGLSSYLGFRETDNVIRLFTGSGMGIALAAFTYPMLVGVLLKQGVRKPVFSAGDKSIVLLLLLPLLCVGTYWILGALSGELLLILSVAFIWITFSAVLLVLVAMIPRFENSVETLFDALVPVLISLATAAVLFVILGLAQSYLKSVLIV